MTVHPHPHSGFPAILSPLRPAERRHLIRHLPEGEALAGEHDWHDSWAHGGQAFPAGDWQTWVIMAGRGFGKTRAGAEWIVDRLRTATEPLRIALVAATTADARTIMVEGEAGLLSVAAPWVRDWFPSLKLLTFAGGHEARLFSGASPDALRGPAHHIAWCDELAKWEKAQETWDMLQFGLRLAPSTGSGQGRPRVIVTTTPRPGPVLTQIMARPGCVVTGGRTYDNPHVPDAYVATIRDMYEGTRLGRQEIDGELLPDAPGALWTVELIERCRVGAVGSGAAGSSGTEAAENTAPLLPTASLPTACKTLIAVDPPIEDGTCGIIACARDAGGHVHVLADHSVTGQSPEGWARAVSCAAAAHGTREVIAESNQGGRRVKSILLTADPGLRIRLVTAQEGKAERAEPVAHLFQAGKAWFDGHFPELEAQLLGLIAGGGYQGPGHSPDRADAMVWGLSMLAKAEPVLRVRSL